MATTAEPEVLHALPGRMRVHVPSWSGAAPEAFEASLAAGSGIRRARASAPTRNVLIEYDPRLAAAAILRRVSAAAPHAEQRTGRSTPRMPPRGVVVTHSSARRARIAVPGLDLDPELARRVVERLERVRGVRRVVPSPLTGRVLVELEEAGADLQAILDEIADIAPPGEEHEVPAHPLDPAPIIEGASRVVGAGIGLALLIARRAVGDTQPPEDRWHPGDVAGAFMILEGIPKIAHGLEERLGHVRKELLFAGVGIVASTSAGSALGLVFAGASGLRVLTEALARRAAWREYEERVGDQPPAFPGAVLMLEPGRRAPLRGRVIAGAAVGQLPDGAPAGLRPGATVTAGMRIYGGTVTVELVGGDGRRPAADGGDRRSAPTAYERYVERIPAVALVAGIATGVVTRSPARALTTVLVLNPRPAMVGAEHADRAAAARVLRAGATVVGSRPDRPVRRPHVLVLDGARVLCDGWEPRAAVPASDRRSAEELLALAGAISASAGSPWGPAFPRDPRFTATDGDFDGRRASADVAGERWSLVPASDDEMPTGFVRRADDHVLAVVRERDHEVAGVVALRPRLAGGTAELVRACRTLGVRIEVVDADASRVAGAVADRAGIDRVIADAQEHVLRQQSEGMVVAVLGDGAEAAEAFEAANLAVGLTSGHSGRFAARADLLAPRLETVGAIVDAGARHDRAVRDAMAISVASNAGGAVWAVRTAPPFSRAGRPVLASGLVAMLDATLRLAGGRREREVVERLADPLPERWGRLDAETVLDRLGSRPEGLTWEEAEQRWTAPTPPQGRRLLLEALGRQLASPLVAFLAGGAALSLAVGAVGDAAMIGAVVVANAAIGAWQERRASDATRALRQMGPPVARVWRSGHEEHVPTRRLVVGDVLSLAPGDRIGADARLIASRDLEVDEAALTGESMPVEKFATGGTDASRVVLEGTDVTAGSGRAVIVAVGPDTRMGAIAAALGENGGERNVMDARLGEIMWHALPYIGLGGVLVAGPGIALGRPALQQLTLGASIAIAAVPEGLPLLAGVAEATVARRLSRRHALVTRLSSIEALGRVDVACVDKTGTLTAGRLAVRCVVDPQGRARGLGRLTPRFRRILRTAAIASPRPDDPGAAAHPTDVAVIEAARAAGLRPRPAEPVAEAPFEPARGFHATVVRRRACVKGAAEVLLPRCSRVRTKRGDRPLGRRRRARLLRRAAQLAGRGLRVLLVAEGPPSIDPRDPTDLVALGFIGIGDAVRPTSRDAVTRCQRAGVRVIMLTGDHPQTALAVAREVGLTADGASVLTGPDLEGLEADGLRRRLEGVSVIARSTPIDKLRIIDALRRGGHAVAMTGDGINDAPALRLADVGVAMGRHGTEVARQASDLVLTDDDFATLVEALIEGRGFWQNMRRALGMLLGGNAGEVATIAGAGITPIGTALTTRQVLTVNLVSDVLPAMTIAMRAPEHRDLATLAREGGAALDGPLRREIVRRAVATAVPSLGASAVAAVTLGPASAAPVAFLSVIGTQLSQTLDLGWIDGRPDPAITGAVAGSVGLLGLAAAFAPTRAFLGLSGIGPAGVGLSALASATAPRVARVVPLDDGARALLPRGVRRTPRLA